MLVQEEIVLGSQNIVRSQLDQNSCGPSTEPMQSKGIDTRNSIEVTFDKTDLNKRLSNNL